MQRFNLIIVVLVLLGAIVFFVENTLAKMPLLAFAIVIFFVSGYRHSLKFTFFLFGLTVFLLSAMIFWGFRIIDIIILSTNYLAIVLTAAFCRKNFKVSLENCRENSEQMDRKFSKLKEEDLKTLQENKKLEDMVSGIEDLYKITKDMSVALEFEKIFAIFQEVIKKRFEFNGCSLIYVEKTQEGAYSVGRTLRISKEAPIDETQAKKTEEALFEYFLTNSKTILVGENQDACLKEKFYLPEAVTTFIAVPLIVERELMGILAMEDLKEDDFEKFIIVAGQFTLEMKKAILYKKVEELALTDGLTGLFVRRHFLKRLKEETERSKRYKLSLALLMVDIDNFKKCNDNYGHLVGDVILKEIASVIKNNIREVDLAGRYGGEELCIALPETDKQGSLQVSERIRSAIENKKVSAYGETIQATVSIGLSVYPKDKKEVTELIQAADEALYLAKRGGKNKTVVYDGGK